MKAIMMHWGKMTLLMLVVLISFIWHLPAAWVWQQSGLKQQLPPALNLTVIKGVWWQGQTQVAWQGQAMGKIKWDWQPSALMTGKFTVDLTVSTSQDQFKTQLNIAASGIELEALSGNIKMATLANMPALALLSDAQGEVIFKDLSVKLPWATLQTALPWPESISGKVALVDFSAMGMQLPLVEATPRLDDNGLTLEVKGQGKGWKLAGQTWLSPKRIFAHDLTLSADSAATMPDWVGLMMRQTQPTQAVLKARGRW